MYRLLSIVIVLAAYAAQAQTVSSNLQAPHDEIWQQEIGSGFRRGAMETGFSAGGGPGMVLLGSKERHDLALGYLHIGRTFTDVVLDDSWIRGNVEGLVEGFGGAQINDGSAYLAGFDLALRYNFATGTRFVPFVTAAAGPSLTDIKGPDLSTTFEFNLQAGAGVHWFFRPTTALTFEYRYIHLSNAGLDSPNCGVNSNLLLLGVNWFF